MESLSTDVLREILDHLDPDYNDSNTRGKHWNPPRNERGARATQADIRQFRLVCRRFADLGAQYLFRTIAHRYNSKSFDRLSNLADHPVYGGYVKKFVYLMPYFYVKGLFLDPLFPIYPPVIIHPIPLQSDVGNF